MRKKMLLSISSFFCKNYKFSISFFFLLTSFFIYRSSDLIIKTGIESYLPKDNQRILKYNEILKSFNTESNIIVLIEGDEEDVKKYADHIFPILQNSPSINRVTYKFPQDFFYKHGLKLIPNNIVDSILYFIDEKQSPYNLLKYSSDLSLSSNKKHSELLFKRLNDFFQLQYDYVINEKFFDSEVNNCGIEVESLCNNTSGKCLWLNSECIESDIASKSADILIFGDAYFYSNGLAMMIVEPSFNSMVSIGELREHINNIDYIVMSGHEEFKVQAGITGSLVYARDEWEVIEKDTYILLSITLIGIFFLLAFFFGSFKGPFYCLFTIVVGLCWTLGIYSFFGNSLTISAIMMSVVLVGLGIDYCIHIFAGFTESYYKNKKNFESILFSLERFGPGVVAGALTTSVAFFAMLYSSNQGIRDLGKIAGIGIISMMLVSIIILPLLLNIFFNDKNYKPVNLFENKFHWFTEIIQANKLKISLFLFPITVFMIYNAANIKYDYNFLNMQPENLKSVKLQHKLIENFNFSSDFVWLTADNLKESSRYLDRISKLDGVGRVESINSFLPDEKNWTRNIMRLRNSFNLNFENFPLKEVNAKEYIDLLYKIESELIDVQRINSSKNLESLIGNESQTKKGVLTDFLDKFNYNDHEKNLTFYSNKVRDVFLSRVSYMANYEPLEISNVPRSISSRFISNNNYHLISVFPSSNIWEDSRYLHEFSTELKKIDANATGMPIIFVDLMDMMIKDTNSSTVLALLLILIVLALDFKSIKYCFLALSPVVFGFIYMFGCMSLLGIKLNLINMSVMPLIFGIGIDDGIHVSHRCKIEKNLTVALSSTGRAVILTTFTTMFGFGMLFNSAHRGLASMGAALFIGVFLCLVATFIIFPLFTEKE